MCAHVSALRDVRVLELDPEQLFDVVIEEREAPSTGFARAFIGRDLVGAQIRRDTCIPHSVERHANAPFCVTFEDERAPIEGTHAAIGEDQRSERMPAPDHLS